MHRPRDRSSQCLSCSLRRVALTPSSSICKAATEAIRLTGTPCRRPAASRVSSGTERERGKMTTFDKREEGFEKKFAQRMKSSSSSLRPAATESCLGMWAAENVLSSPEGRAYAEGPADFEITPAMRMFLRNSRILTPRIAVTDTELRKQMDELLSKAVKGARRATVRGTRPVEMMVTVKPSLRGAVRNDRE